jgi:hypothetical protein
MHTLFLIFKNKYRYVVPQAFQKIKRIQLQRYHSTDDPEKKTSIETNPLKIFHSALINSKPVLQLTPIKRGGVTYKVGWKYSGFPSNRGQISKNLKCHILSQHYVDFTGSCSYIR